jgi:hypothetical protein
MMDMAKIVWKASREQFKYALAMNDIIYKADMQMKNSELTEDTAAWAALSANRPVINFLSAPDVAFKLSPNEFWRVFTAPSLGAMLHYSVNSYLNTATYIPNPIADAFLAEKAKGDEGTTTPAPEDETPEEETPEEETPVDVIPEETPVDETPVDETPVDETPVDETPVDETPVDETPVDETPVDETPADETPSEETPDEETPAEETPDEETPDEETPSEETPSGDGNDIFPDDSEEPPYDKYNTENLDAWFQEMMNNTEKSFAEQYNQSREGHRSCKDGRAVAPKGSQIYYRITNEGYIVPNSIILMSNWDSKKQYSYMKEPIFEFNLKNEDKKNMEVILFACEEHKAYNEATAKFIDEDNFFLPEG